MNKTFRDRNEEQTTASLLYACRQSKDESFSSFISKFQQLIVRSPSSSKDDKNKNYDLWNALNQTTRNHLIGRPLPVIYNEFLEFLYTVGSEMEELGLVKTRAYSPNQFSVFDDNIKDVTGGKLLGSFSYSNTNRGSSNPSPQRPSDKDADSDIMMTGVSKVRAK